MPKAKLSSSNFIKYSKTIQKRDLWRDHATKLKPSDLMKSFVQILTDDPDASRIIGESDMKNSTIFVNSAVSASDPIFQSSPQVVIFKNYEPFKIYEQKIYFRNNDQFPRQFHIHHVDHPHFEISTKNFSSQPLKYNKIASGMEVCYVIRFKPHQAIDYFFDLKCSSERESFIVPIKAIASIPEIVLPDKIDFGRIQVKSSTGRTYLIQNSGKSSLHFSMNSLSSHFSCSQNYVIIKPGESSIIEILFTPLNSQQISGEIEIEFGPNLRCYISVMGIGCDAAVSLSTSLLTLNPCYLSLSSQATFRVKNDSNQVIDYSWKSFSTLKEDNQEKLKLLQEINQLEVREMFLLHQTIFTRESSQILSGSPEGNDRQALSPLFINNDQCKLEIIRRSDNSIGSNSSNPSLSDNDADIDTDIRIEEAKISRKYLNMRTSLENDPMYFTDLSFQIIPTKGTIWANSETEFRVTFTPEYAGKFSSVAFADVSGREDRLPLSLNGVGLGPQANLSFNVLDVGDVVVNHAEVVELTITNRGDITAVWHVLPPQTALASRFKFSELEGTLIAGDAQTLRVTYDGIALGSFMESFRFALQGNDDLLVCHIKGEFVGPTIHFDCSSIRFGLVSYDCLHSTQVRLVNASKIPIKFKLHVPEDAQTCRTQQFEDSECLPKQLSSMTNSEFILHLPTDILEPGEHTDITIDFIPQALKTYNYSLCVDVVDIADSWLVIPILAECRASVALVVIDYMKFGDCYLNYAYEQEFQLINPSKSCASKYEVIGLQGIQTKVANIDIFPSSGVITANSMIGIKLCLTPLSLGSQSLSLHIKLAGSSGEDPIEVPIHFKCIGPCVKTNITTELKFESIPCLKDFHKEFTIQNTGPISAPVRLFTKFARSKFNFSIPENFILYPQDTKTIVVTANLDDSVTFSDEIHLLVENGDHIVIPVSAKGIGSTISCDVDISSVDIGINLTNTLFEKRVVLTNKGRRVQSLRWTNKTITSENSMRVTQIKHLDKVHDKKLINKLQPVNPIFTVSPSEITLLPQTSATFTFEGSSKIPGIFKECFVLESIIGKERVMKQLFETVVSSNVITPLLTFSSPELEYSYVWHDNDSNSVIQKQGVVLTNLSSISLYCYFSVDCPFSLSSYEQRLSTGESFALTLTFDPFYSGDKVNHSVNHSLNVSYRGHAQIDTLSLKGRICFPNLIFDSPTLSFGCILNSTHKTIKMVMTNPTEIIVDYEWYFIEPEATMATGIAEVSSRYQPDLSENCSTSRLSLTRSGSRKSNLRPVSLIKEKIIDIVPVRSSLRAGTSDTVEFRMTGVAEGRLEGFVKCVVKGGPEYIFPITGEASNIEVVISQSIVDFGVVDVATTAQREFVIINKGKVDFDFDISPLSNKLATLLNISPMTGSIQAGKDVKITLKFVCNTVQIGYDTISINIAHFDPVKVDVTYKTSLPTIFIELPRCQNLTPFGQQSVCCRDDSEQFTNDLRIVWDDFKSIAENMAFNNLIVEQHINHLIAIGADKVIEVSSATPPMYHEVTDEDLVLLDKSESNSVYITPSILDLYMQNIVFNSLISEHTDLSSEQVKCATFNSPLTLLKTAPSLKPGHTQPFPLAKITTAHYYCNLGNVIIGSTKKKSFTLKNLSSTGPIDWKLDPKCFSVSDFVFEAVKGKVSQNGSVDFLLKCTPNLHARVGDRELRIDFHIYNSISISVHVTVVYCTPELVISHPILDFGSIILGRTRQQYVSIQNTSKVKTTWKFKYVVPSSSQIKITPTQGDLRPGKLQWLLIEFMPTEAKAYSYANEIRIESNSKPLTFNAIGTCLPTPIVFDANPLHFGTVLPNDTSFADRVINIRNPSAFPIEICCPDFDIEFLTEQQALAKLDTYDESNILRCGIREPGGCIPPDLQQLVDSSLVESLEISSAGTKPIRAESGSFTSERSVSVTLNLNTLTKPIIQSETGPRLAGLCLDVVLMGVPIPEIDNTAAKLSNKFMIPCLTIDNMIEAVSHSLSPVGYELRKAMNALTQDEVMMDEKLLNNLKLKSDESQVEVSKKYKKKNPKAKGVPADILQTQEFLVYSETLNSKPVFNEGLLQKVLDYRLTWRDLENGVLINTNSILKYCDSQVAMCSLTKVFSKAVVIDLALGGDKENYSKFIVSRHQNLQSAIAIHNNAIMTQTELLRELVADEKASLFNFKFQRGKKASASNPLSTVLEPILTSKLESIETLGGQNIFNDEMGIVPATCNEPWYDAENNNKINVLDKAEWKALSPSQKLLYTRNFIYQLSSELDDLKNRFAAYSKLLNSNEIVAISGEPPSTYNITVDASVVSYDYYHVHLRPHSLSLDSSLPTSISETTEPSHRAVIDIEAESVADITLSEMLVDDFLCSQNVDWSNGIKHIQLQQSQSQEEIYRLVENNLPSRNEAYPIKDTDGPPFDIRDYQVIRKPDKFIYWPKQFQHFSIIHSSTSPTSLIDESCSSSSAEHQNGNETRCRWVIPANSDISIHIRFESSNEKLGVFQESIKFQVLGSYETFNLKCIGSCEYPQISSDPRHVFMNRVVKTLPSLESSYFVPPAHKFITSSNFYSFGPLHVHNEVDMSNLEGPNSGIIRVTNVGKFGTSVQLSPKCNTSQNDNVFFIQPERFHLDENAIKDVRIFAFPTECREYAASLQIIISNNPEPLLFELRCWGTKPTAFFAGPWESVIESQELLISTTSDRKLKKEIEVKSKDLKDNFPINFGRVLVGKIEEQSFTLKSASMLPIKWALDPQTFSNSNLVQFSSLEGTIQPGCSETFKVSISNTEPTNISGLFSINYSDSDSITKVAQGFRVQGEIYAVQAIAIVGETGSNASDLNSEIDFGVLKVGEVCKQSLSLTNKGKYDIAFKIEISDVKLSLQSLLKFEPTEGIILPGKPVTVKATFCCCDCELSLQCNRDVRVLISEPKTAEIVESFPLYISASCKYSKFRISPSRGLSFGASRFSTQSKLKTIDITNEGCFELRYVIATSSSKLSELDHDLLACYGSSVASSLRSIELGENYSDLTITKATARSTSSTAAKKIQPAALTNNKAKSQAISPNDKCITQYVSTNQLVSDPDIFPSVSISSNSFTVGPFTLLPRVGIIYPGQTVSIECKYTPVSPQKSRDTIRLFISGCAPNDGMLELIESYELTAECCMPAISTDARDIFEDQVIYTKPPRTDVANIEWTPPSGVYFSKDVNVLHFGYVLCGESQNHGIVERIKIKNPTKIDAKINFKVLPSYFQAYNTPIVANGSGPKTGSKLPSSDRKDRVKPKQSIPECLGFTVHPECWDVPANEHRYVNIYFNPTEMKSYNALFKAEVDYSATGELPIFPNIDVSMNSILQFELNGSGTLPWVTIEQPTSLTLDGKLLLDFGTIHVGTKVENKVVLRNDGIFPVVCFFDFTGHHEYTVSHRGTSVAIDPNRMVEVTATLRPHENAIEGLREGTLKITVLNNPFGCTTVSLKAQVVSYDALFIVPSAQSDIQFVNSAIDNHIILPDIKLDSNKSMPSSEQNSTYTVIQLQSRSDEVIRFSMTVQDSDFTSKFINVSPSIGHLQAYSVKDIKLSFSSSEPICLEKIKLACTLQRVQLLAYDDESVRFSENWDNSRVITRIATYDDKEELAQSAATWEKFHADKKKSGSKSKALSSPAVCRIRRVPTFCVIDGVDSDAFVVEETVLEPPYETSPNISSQLIQLFISASADTLQYSCDIASETLNFLTTYMHQSSVHKFTFTNDCNLRIPLKWTFEDIRHRVALSRQRTSRPYSSELTSKSIMTLPPFTITPVECLVGPKTSQELTLIFHPVDVDEYNFLITAQLFSDSGSILIDTSVAQCSSTLSALVKGVSKRPICLFEIEESVDYLSKRSDKLKNEKGQFSPLECPNIRVVEIQSVGLKNRNTFRFTVLNSNNEDYEYIWETVDGGSPFWQCLQKSGTLFAGKRSHVVFEYAPEDTTIAEAFYKFKIARVQLEQLFLFAGVVKEPSVNFSNTKVDFQTASLHSNGIKEIIYIENSEHIPFKFTFDKSLIKDLLGPRGPILDIEPKTGIVPPNSHIPVALTFKPQEEIQYNFNLLCDVKRKPTKLSLNVKGEGFALHPTVRIEYGRGDENLNSNPGSCDTAVTLLPAPHTNFCDFGLVQLFETVSRKIVIYNEGKYVFDYIYEITNTKSSFLMTTSNGRLSDSVLKGTRAVQIMSFTPQVVESIDDVRITLSIANKFVYQIAVRGKSVSPALKFSFTHHDFGPSFISSESGSVVFETANLLLTNYDEINSIAIECAFQKNRSLIVECPPMVLDPKQELSIPIRFAPREVKNYAFVVPFIINSKNKVNIHVSGTGIQPKLELVELQNRKVSFGTVDVNTIHNRTVKLMNKSVKAMLIKLCDCDNAFADKFITCNPSVEVQLLPKESVNVNINFSPTKRLASFTHHLSAKYAGATKQLLSISGKAQGTEVRLDSDHLFFGTVVLNSQTSKRVLLENIGDLPVTYQWLQSTLGPHFVVTPMSGTVLPSSELSFDILFRPGFTNHDINQNIQLSVAGLQIFPITCTGSCVSKPSEDAQTLEFKSKVRTCQEITIKIPNVSDSDWFIHPSVNSKNWIIPSQLHVPAKSSADLHVKYLPLTMTSTSNTHTADLFLPCLDGSAISYLLKGTSDIPLCESTVEFTGQAQKQIQFTLQASNWLSRTQKFLMTYEIKDSPTIAVSILLPNSVELGPNETKLLHGRLTCACEGVVKGTVTMTNSDTKEYMFFDVVANILTGDIIDTLSLETIVRQSTSRVIYIENPLPSDATVHMGPTQTINESPASGDLSTPPQWWFCSNSCIKVKELVPLSGNHEGSFEIEYRPLVVTSTEQIDSLTICTKELGVLKYSLVLRGNEPVIRPAIHLKAALGSTEIKSFSFKSFHLAPCEYSTRFLNANNADKSVFSVPKLICANACHNYGIDISSTITFEPSDLGECNDTLVITSSQYGTYEFDVRGQCSVPLPQGPIEFSQNKLTVDIPFRNCFTVACNWSFHSDNSLFSVASPSSMVVPGKGSGTCTITFNGGSKYFGGIGSSTANDPNDNNVIKTKALGAPAIQYGETLSPATVTGKLFLSCKERPDIAPWVYYLKGQCSE